MYIFPCSHGNGKFTVRIISEDGEENIIFDKSKHTLMDGKIIDEDMRGEYRHPVLGEALNLRNMSAYPVASEFAYFLKQVLLEDGWVSIGRERHTWAGNVQRLVAEELKKPPMQGPWPENKSINSEE